MCGQDEHSKSKGRSISILLYRLKVDRVKIQRARELWKEQVNIKKERENQRFSELSLPKEYRPLYEPSSSYFHERAKNYVLSRGMTELDIVKYRIGYCVDGRYSDRVILPSYDESGQLNFFAGRSWLPEPSQKFIVPDDIDKDIICYESTINWSDPVIIVESQFNAITIRRNAIPLNGKSIPTKLKQKIIERNPPKVVLCLDGDALTTAMKHAQYFIQNGVPVYKVNIPANQDANSLGYEAVWELIDAAERITESDSFQFKILNRLKGQ